MSSKGGTESQRASQKLALQRIGYMPPGTRQCCGNCLRTSDVEQNGQVRCIFAKPTVRVSKLGWCPNYTNEK